MIHNLLLELVVLPNVLALALNQVNYFGLMGGPCDYCVSTRSKSFFLGGGGLLFDLGACWDQDLDQGLTIILILSLKCWGQIKIIL